MNVIENWLKRKKLQHIFSVKENTSDYPYQFLSMRLAVPTHPINDWLNCFNITHICNTFTSKLIDVQRNVTYGNHSMVYIGAVRDFAYINLMTKKPIFEIDTKDLTTNSWKEIVIEFLDSATLTQSILFVPLDAECILPDIYGLCFKKAETPKTEEETARFRIQIYFDLLENELKFGIANLYNYIAVGNKYSVGTTIYSKNVRSIEKLKLITLCKAIVINKIDSANIPTLDLFPARDALKIDKALETMPKLHSIIWIRDHGWCVDDM